MFNSLKVADIKDCDLLNGSGLRVSVWFQGCEHKCKGCHNPTTWDENQGDYLIEHLDKLEALLSRDEIKGVTLTGGDPLFSPRISDMTEFVTYVKERFPNKDIWCYTGYTYEMLSMLPEYTKILSMIDVLVDGKYIESCRDVDIPWRGSKNQRVIDIKRTLASDSLYLLCD